MGKRTDALNQILSIFTSFVLLNVLWIIFCLPIVTIFPATAALFGTVRKWIREGFVEGVFRVFLQHFKGSFKKSFIIGMMWSCACLILYLDFAIMIQNDFIAKSLLFILLCFCSMFFAFTAIYLFLVLANYDLSIRHTWKNSLLLSISHLPYTILIFGIILIESALIYYFPILFLVGASTSAFCIYGIFHRLSIKLERENTTDCLTVKIGGIKNGHHSVS